MSQLGEGAPRLIAVVVLPTPPFWFAIEMTRAKMTSGWRRFVTGDRRFRMAIYQNRRVSIEWLSTGMRFHPPNLWICQGQPTAPVGSTIQIAGAIARWSQPSMVAAGG